MHSMIFICNITRFYLLLDKITVFINKFRDSAFLSCKLRIINNHKHFVSFSSSIDDWMVGWKTSSIKFIVLKHMLHEQTVVSQTYTWSSSRCFLKTVLNYILTRLNLHKLTNPHHKLNKLQLIKILLISFMKSEITHKLYNSNLNKFLILYCILTIHAFIF